MRTSVSGGNVDNLFENAGLDTLAIRAGTHRTEEGEHSEALFLTSSYVFANSAEAAARFSGDQPGNVYSRYTNPTVRSFEQRIAALEGGEAAVATASGMAAILATCMALLEQGDHIVCSRSVFGTTTALFTRYMEKFGVDVDMVSLTDLQAWENALTDKTKFMFLETPSNPLCDVADIGALSVLARKHDVWLVVDNCFCTPALQKPLELGADIVIHSATKYLDGQGRCLGGAVVGPRELMEPVLGFVRTCGPTLSAFNAWVFSKGLETLRLRMEAHSANALRVAEWLSENEWVEAVNYAGLTSHPGHELARRQQSAYGGVLSFAVRGDKHTAWTLIDACKMLSLTANLGDTKSTIVHPATTTHGRLSEEERRQARVGDNLIRIAVGLEDVKDIIEDLRRGLAAVRAGR